MGKKDVEISQLQGQQRRQQSELDQAETDKKNIEEKLQRLEQAKKDVNAVQRSIGSLKPEVAKKKEQDLWKGKNKETFESMMADLDGDYKTYYDGVDDLYDAICDEITRLENEANDATGVIGWLQNSLNNIGNELEKLFHF